MQRENPMELNFEGLLNFEMQKVNVTTDRAQLVAEKNGVICLVVMFALRVMVMKMSKMFEFSKKLVTVWAKYLRASERSY